MASEIKTPQSKKEMLSISGLKTPQDHLNKVRELINARWEHEREWKLNHAFYCGNQYAFFPKKSNSLITLATEPAELPRYRVRLVSNQIMPGVRSLVSKLTKTKPVIHAVPANASEKAARGAQLAERLQEYWWKDLNLTAKRNEAWTWAQIGGQGWWKIGWDFNAGKTFTYTIGPDGRPIIKDKLAELFEESMLEQGVEPIRASVSLGEVRVDVVPPHDIVLDPSPTDYTDCQYAYCIHRLDPDEVYKRWKVWLTPDTTSDNPENPYSMAKEELAKDLVTVYVGYIRKSPVMPRGKYVVFSPNYEKFLYNGDWPYPFDDLPLVKFPGIQIPGCVYDRAVTSDARPLQMEFNKSISQIIEYKNLNISPQFVAPAGSMMRNRITGEPGAIWYYNATSVGGGSKPEAIQLGALPPYIFENLNFTLQRLKDIFQMTDVSEGTLPPNLEAGVAIDLLQEVAIDQLEPQIQQGEMSLARAGEILLSYAQEYYDEPRLAKIYGGGLAQIKAFSKSDIKDVDIFVEAGSGIPRTRAGRMQRIKGMIEQQLIRPDQAWKYYDMADMKSLSQKFAIDEEKAFRENDLLLRNIPLNPVAMQSAMSAIQQGINPQNGMQLQSQEEAQSLLMDASLEPGAADNHFIEMDIHALTMKSEEYSTFPPEVQQAFETHYGKHAAAASASQREMIPPRISYQVKGTAGPSAAASLLGAAGVEVTPEQMTEPPLETWVTDSVDKPDKDEAGNDPFTGLDQQMVTMEQMAKLAQMSLRLREQQVKLDIAGKRRDVAKTTVKKKNA